MTVNERSDPYWPDWPDDPDPDEAWQDVDDGYDNEEW